MSKKLLIKNVKLLKESKDIDIPIFIQKVFQTRKHTLGDNPIFPDSEEITYEEKVLKKRFNELKDNLVKLGLNPKDEQSIKDVFTDSIKKCLVIEKTNSDNLTEIALNMIKNIFSIPENILINANLGELKENLPKYQWHALACVKVMSRYYHVYDKQYLNAIYHHVLGKSNQAYSMMLYISDKAERTRGYDSEPIIALSKIDLNKGFSQAKKSSQSYLKRKEIT